MILIFHQNPSAFLRWLPSQDFKSQSFIMSGFFALVCIFPLFSTGMPYLSPNYVAIARLQGLNLIQHILVDNRKCYRDYTKSILYSSQLS